MNKSEKGYNNHRQNSVVFAKNQSAKAEKVDKSVKEGYNVFLAKRPLSYEGYFLWYTTK